MGFKYLSHAHTVSIQRLFQSEYLEVVEKLSVLQTYSQTCPVSPHGPESVPPKSLVSSFGRVVLRSCISGLKNGFALYIKQVASCKNRMQSVDRSSAILPMQQKDFVYRRSCFLKKLNKLISWCFQDIKNQSRNNYFYNK